MPTHYRLIFFLIALMAIFLFSPEKAFAQVVINELLPNPGEGPDWVELYNPTSQEVDLNSWVLDDEGTKTNMVEIKETTIDPHRFCVFEVGSRLNKNGDIVYLINNQEQIVDEYKYTDNPGDDVSFGRMPDGGEWGICSEPTPDSENNCILPSPSPSLSSEQSPSPTPESLSSSQPEETTSSIESPSPKAVKVTGTTLLGKILGEEGSPAGFFPWEATEEGKSQEATESSKAKFIPKLFLGLGMVFLLASGGWIWYTQLK